jgi:cytoskeletal protein RodZ
MNEILTDSDENYNEGSVGAWLRELREAKKLSISDVAGHLRLREERIVALENDEYHDDIGTYIKGYIRGYASLLNVDVALIEAKLRQVVSVDRVFASPMKTSEVSKYPLNSLWKKNRLLFVLGLFILFVVMLVSRPWLHGAQADMTRARIVDLVKIEPEKQTLGEVNSVAADNIDDDDRKAQDSEKSYDLAGKSLNDEA